MKDVKKQSQPQGATLPQLEPGVIRTYTGKMINVFEPDPELICIEDIAHALSNLCRFGGHTRRFYSVAEHSMRVANEVPYEYRLTALLHDASEAYMIDLPSPIKYFIPKYREYELNLMLTIAERFGFDYPLASRVTDADKRLLEIEWAELMQPGHLGHNSLRPSQAAIRFIGQFNNFSI